MPWKPKPREDVDLTALPLDAQEGFLLSRLDGASDVPTLSKLTGLPPERIESLLEGLVRAGAVAEEREPGREAGAGGLAADLGAPSPADGSGRSREPGRGSAEGDGAPDPPEETGGDPPSPEAPPDPEGNPGGEAGAGSDPGTPSHRALFETALHPLPTDERTALAKTAADPDLSALCFDPVAAVALALLDNPRFGLAHARLVAANHHTAVGLDALASRAPFAADDGVRRALLRNPQLPAAVFRRLWSSRRLQDLWLAATSREATEGTRSVAREVLRTAFAQRTGDEKVELIVGSEGRCLALLQGLPLDAKATALLCRRSYVSSLFIQNLARWSATPPQLVAHLRRQETVKRTPQLRLLLERHPNAS